jgi:hypothetical protein
VSLILLADRGLGHGVSFIESIILNSNE